MNKIFSLIRLHLTFDGFSVSGDCGGVRASVSYSEIGVQLERAVSFTAVPATGRGYTFTIPRELFLIQVIDRRDGELERSLRRPSEDVTGAIDLDTGRFSIHVVTAQTMHFQGGCFVVCAIDEHDRGTITANVSGTLAFPDTDADGVPDHLDNCPFFPNADQSPVSTPTIDAPPNVTLFSCLDHTIGGATGTDVCGGGPVTISNNAPARFPVGSTTVTWTATDSKNRSATDTQVVTVIDKARPTVACTATNPVGTSFIVTGGDACGDAVLRLGSYVIANGEQIKIEETGQPGVRLQNVVGKDGLRKFLVGKSQGVIVATDGSGNRSAAACRYPK